MAGDWIKWTKGLAKRREVLGIASRLSLDPIHVAGLCMTFWEWLDDNVSAAQIDENGNAFVTLGALQHDFIDSLVCASGFAAALTAEGWLTIRTGSLTVPNYCRHNGQTSKERALTAERVAKHRAKTCNGASVTREEKKREEVTTPKSPSGTCVCFEKWWLSYPKIRQCNKQTAKKRYSAAGKILTARGMTKQDAVAFLQSKVEEFARSPLGQSRYAPAADVWLNKGRYDDNPAAWQLAGDDRGEQPLKPDGNAKHTAETLAHIADLEKEAKEKPWVPLMKGGRIVP